MNAPNAPPQNGQDYRRLTQHDVDIICAKHDRLWAARLGGARAVFAFCDLSGLSVAGRNLCDADFTGAILAGCDMRMARLDNSSFFGADIQGADLTDASLRRADLRASSLRGANLTGADMFEADLREGSIAAADRKEGYRVIEAVVREAYANGTQLNGANLERSRMSGIMAVKADFTDAILKDAKMVRANLKQAIFNGANLAGADLSGANLSGADLRNAILVGTQTFSWNISETNMEGALTDKPFGQAVATLPYEEMIKDHARWCETGGVEGAPSSFDNADLRGLRSVGGFNLTALSAKGAVFYGLDMEGVQMQGAQLEGADLRACNLRHADLRGARLMGAKLSGSDLRDAQLGPLVIGRDRLLPSDLTGALLTNTDLARADLRQARLIGADLSRANFTSALLKDVDISGAIRVGARGLEDIR
ncbi:MAG: pentapeptide repeat protein [Caulobacter sp.]|nr:pentapeptide repeat protein [Caulobacter sp.]